MARSIAVLIPVLDRPQRVKPLVENLQACSRMIECFPVFVATETDATEIAEIERTDGAYLLTLPGELRGGDYARKINYGFEQTDTPFVFLGADDLHFHTGWAERAVAAWYETEACVIGTNDLANPRVTSGKHSTHFFVCREYGECGTIDNTSKLVHDGYFHNYVDNEFVETAISRQTYYQALDVHVEHSHPIWKTAAMDATYERGQQGAGTDARLFQKRRRLWSR